MKAAHKLVLSLLVAPIGAEACSCVRIPTMCESLSTAKVAFIGTVTQGTEPDSIVEPRQGFGARPAVVAVETLVRGLKEDVREVSVDPAVGASCYLQLKAGERWLIFGGISASEPNLVHAGICSRSREIRPDNTEISKIVASYLEGPNLFFGSVRLFKGWDSKWSNDNLLSGAEVKLTGAAKEWSARTGESGKFEVRGLPSGEYRFTVSRAGLSAELAEDSISFEGKAPGKIVMPEHGCVETPVLMWPDTKISGTVRSIEGTPIAGIKVAAYKWDSGNRRRPVRSAITSEDGRYVIQRLLAGRYAVGIASESSSDEAYPPSFHPSASTLQGATPVSIADGKSTGQIDIVVPAKRKAVTIQVRVLWPDKRPAAMAMIRAEHPEDGTFYAGSPTDPRSGFTDADGFTTIRLYGGTEYMLSATWQQLEHRTDGLVGRTLGWHRTNRIRLIAATEATVALTLSEKPEPPSFR